MTDPASHAPPRATTAGQHKPESPCQASGPALTARRLAPAVIRPGPAALTPEGCRLPADPSDLAASSPGPPRARHHWTLPPGHQWTFPARRDQVGLARQALATVLDGCPVADEAVFCLSELAANAVVHSASGRARSTFTVHAEIHPGRSVLVEVRDDGGPWQPGDDPDGLMHGLQIVEAIAAELAVEDHDSGRTVRVRLDWPPGQGAAP